MLLRFGPFREFDRLGTSPLPWHARREPSQWTPFVAATNSSCASICRASPPTRSSSRLNQMSSPFAPNVARNQQQAEQVIVAERPEGVSRAG